MVLDRIIKKWAISNKSTNSQLVISESIIDKFFGTKIAADSMDDAACKILSSYLSMLRAMFILHQQNHWDSLAYQEHLLFQRLYEDVHEMVDEAGEKIIGLCGHAIFENEEDLAKKFVPRVKTFSSLIESSLNIERAFQNIAQNVYDTIKEKEMMTLGLDDQIMNHCSRSENHIYLLQQALKGLGDDMGSVADHAKEILEKTESLKDILVVAGRKRKPEYKPKDVIEYIEAALKVRPYEEVVDYIKGLDEGLLDQVINILMKTNPGLLKKIFVSSIAGKTDIEVEDEVHVVAPPSPGDIKDGLVIL